MQKEAVVYGLVNKAIEDMVIRRFGEDVWETVCERAGVQVEFFDSLTAYPDQVTYDLVQAASEILDVPSNHLLEAFGEYWILYTAREGYGGMFDTMASAGGLLGFLLKLNQMHARVRQLYTEYTPPVFRCTEVSATSLRLKYYSRRNGLAPMMIGLIKGLAAHFQTPTTVTQTQHKGVGGCDYDEFLVCVTA